MALVVYSRGGHMQSAWGDPSLWSSLRVEVVGGEHLLGLVLSLGYTWEIPRGFPNTDAPASPQTINFWRWFLGISIYLITQVISKCSQSWDLPLAGKGTRRGTTDCRFILLHPDEERNEPWVEDVLVLIFSYIVRPMYCLFWFMGNI